MTDVELCPWTLPDDSQHKGTLSDCVRLPDHDGPHVVGLSSKGWVLLWEVHLEERKLERIVHAQLDGPAAGREQMAALLAIFDVAAEKGT